MLLYAKAESGKLELQQAPVQLQPLLADVVRLLQADAVKQGISVTLEVAPGFDTVVTDPQLLTQAVANLLSNAIKFTPEGGRVTLQATLDPDGGLRLEVRDTGIGVAASDIPRALEPFGQVNNPLTRRHQGAGSTTR